MALFVDPDKAKEFECPICLEILKAPVQIGCEEHIFCDQCIDKLKTRSDDNSFPCPMCKVQCSIDSITRVKFVDRKIRDLQVKCANTISNKAFIGNSKTENKLTSNTILHEQKETKIGRKRRRSFDNNDDKDNDINTNNNKRRKLNENESCEWQGRYSDLNIHIMTCPLQSVSCQYCSCSKLRRELDEHYDECPGYPIKCEKCHSGIVREDMRQHIFEFCPMTVLSCDACKQLITRADEEFHLENTCPESLILCAFYKFGCKDKLKRKDEQNHIENAAFTHNHLVQISNHQLKLENTVNELKNEIKSLNEKIDAVQNTQVQSQNKIYRNHGKIDILARRMNSNETTISTLPKNYDNAKIVYVDDKGTLYRSNPSANKVLDAFNINLGL